MEKIIEQDSRTDVEIAVIGMSGRFPGAVNTDEFWNNLKNGVESVIFFPDDRLIESGIDSRRLNNPDFVKSNGGVLEDKEYFDAHFFSYTPGEAEMMNPQMRIFHECAWEALEDAGYEPGSYDGSIGLYAGASSSFYWEALTFLSGKRDEMTHLATNNIANKDFLSTRVAYKFDLKGPAITVQTACSTSLVAVHLACQAILDGECDMALAGGVSISSGKNSGYLYQEGMIASADGHCRAFDGKATGTIGGEGAGVVVLKLLESAIEDRDYIHGVVKGTAINNDGKKKASFTAPSREAHTETVRAALRVAEVDPESISYIETHGTGTPLGDPIEIEALKQAFNTDKKQFCAIGSVKTNIGHLDAAAGIAGFIKAVLALKHRFIPPSLHFEKANPKIDFENSPFFVNTELREWKNDKYPLRAGVSSLGIGGTNAHVVLEAAPPLLPASSPGGRGYKLLLLSAHTPTALDKTAAKLAAHLKENPGINPADAAFTLQVGRKAFQHRRLLVCSNVNDAVEALSSPGSGKVRTFFAPEDNRPVVFMFSGQGSQYVRMGLELYREEPIFRDEMDRCFDILSGLTDYPLKDILYPPAAQEQGKDVRINQTAVTQPLLFAFEYALAKLLISWGIEPYAMIGHSIGEYTAACLSGVFSLEDALEVVALRGKLMKEMPPGAMLSVPLPETEVLPLLDEEISLAAVNSSAYCVVSGRFDSIKTFEKTLKENGYEGKPLHTSHAFHSNMMDPILEEFERSLEQVELNKPRLPFISNVTGDWIKAAEAVDASYWAKHLRSTVRFSPGLEKLFEKENAVFVEIGPGKTLASFVKQHKDKKSRHPAVNLVRHPKENETDDYYLLNKLGELWLYGVKINWNDFYSEEKRTHVPLPTYPFQGLPYWIHGDLFSMGAQILAPESGIDHKKHLPDFFYVPLWKPSPSTVRPVDEALVNEACLVFTTGNGFGAELVSKLKENGYDVFVVGIGEEFKKIDDRRCRINPAQVKDYHGLLRDMKRNPRLILHLWSITGQSGPGEKLDFKGFDNAQETGFYSLVYLLQAIKEQNITDDVNITVVSDNIHEVTGEETPCPEKATLMGPVKVIPQESPNVLCRSIDVVLPESGTWREEKLLEQLTWEIFSGSIDTVVAYRNNRRWTRTFEPVRLEGNREYRSPLRKGGVYLITGGLGGVGLLLAEYLAAAVGAKLVLTGRSAFPHREEWKQRLTTHDETDGIAQKIRKIREIEKTGGEVMILNADAADTERMQAAITRAEERFGTIDGVIHAAGVIGGNANKQVAEQLTPAECRRQFHAKAYGLLVLEKVLEGKDLDFCLLTSSLSSILGGLGFTAYSAANIFMDAFVKKYNRTHSRAWISVDWDGWQLGENVESLELTPEEGKEAFSRILAWGEESQVVVSTRDLQARIDRWLKARSLRGEESTEDREDSSLAERPALTSTYAAPRGPVEETITGIWQTFFGFRMVGIYDDFFELGGDSIKAIQLASRMNKAGYKVTVKDIFQSPRISELASLLKKAAEEMETVTPYADSPSFLKEKTYWRELEQKVSQGIPRVKEDFEVEHPSSYDPCHISFILGQEETRLMMTRANEALNTEVRDLVLTALGLSVKRICGIDVLLIALEAPNTAESLTRIDISRAIEDFTGLFPVLLDFSYESGENQEIGIHRQVVEVKETLRRVPQEGVGYGILKHLTDTMHKKELHLHMEVDARFRLTLPGQTQAPHGSNRYDFDVSVMNVDEKAVVSIQYNRKKYKKETVESLLDSFEKELSNIICYCAAREERELTPSDLTYKELPVNFLDQLRKQYSIQDVYTLTSMQEGMLFYALYERKDTSPYFEQMSYRLQGPLDISLVEKSLNELFKRHDILRTLFIYEGLERPVQVVLKERKAGFFFEDIRGITAGDEESKKAYIQKFRDKDIQRSFDLKEDVLMRVSILQTGSREYQVIWSHHHILMDGWCMGVLISEFLEIYDSYLENRVYKLPPVTPFRTYIQWLEKQDREVSGEFWSAYMEGYEEPAGLPRKRVPVPGASKDGYNSVGTSALLEKESAEALKKLAMWNRVTLNTVFHAVWAIVLGKYCGKTDVVFGGVVSGRPSELEGVETIIGCFINTIPVRIQYDGRTKFNDLLKKVQEKAIQSEPHHYFSLAETQAGTKLKKNLLDHIFLYQNLPFIETARTVQNRGEDDAPGNAASGVSDVEMFEQNDYDFNVSINPGEEFRLKFGYNANVYDSELVGRVGLHSIRVLEQVLNNEEIAIDEIILLSREEKRQILVEFNGNRADFSRDKSLYRLIEEYAETAPHRIAVECIGGTATATAGRQVLTYRELNKRAGRLAGVLRACGIGHDQLVGVLSVRSLSMVVSILAVWKAGGAYIPLDTGYPLPRITGILNDSGAAALITWEEHVNPTLENEYPGEIICLNSQSEPDGKTSYPDHGNSDSTIDMNSLAYVIYTSGSTGKPKGAMVEHIGMMNHIQAKINDLRLTEKCTVVQNASHTFDISVWQFFVALAVGGKTVIYSGELIMEPHSFISTLVNDRVTILEVVPSYLSVMLDILGSPEPSVPPAPLSLDYLLVTGEEIKPPLVKEWFDCYPAVKMVNAYGPTEASDDITHYIMDNPPHMERIPIGKPLQNLNIYIVDNSMQLCPIGVKGEIWVSGVGVGRGYLGDEEKTRQVFMEDPFAGNDSVRLYKTGDLGAWLPDGTVEFFGRKDYQVKIRGFRIELGEIENRLLAHEEVREAVVLDKEDDLCNKYLCAYVVSNSPHPVESAVLNEHLGENLPQYMIPSIFIQLPEIPLTPNGKVDRNALPEPESGKVSGHYTAPRSRTEEKLVEIWVDVLKKKGGSIGVEQNFFDLGGHSLKAIILVSKIHKEFDIKLPLTDLFRAPTIKDIAGYIKKAVLDRFAPIGAAEKKEYHVLSSAQKRLYLEQEMDREGTRYNQPQTIVLKDKPDKDKLEDTFKRLIDRHESLRTSFHLIGNTPVQKIHPQVKFSIDYFETDEKEARENSEKIEGPFDLGNAPLLRVALFNVEEKHHVLMVVTHHVISDAISYGLLMEDFRALYEGRKLLALRLQYKDYAEWQSSPGQLQRIKKQEAFWLKEFSGEIPLLKMVTDYDRPPIQDTRGKGILFVVAKKELEGLRRLTREESVSMFMLLLAVYNILLSKLSGQEDIVVGTPSAGRIHSDLEGIIGMFINTLVLRNQPATNYSFTEFLKKVKEKTLMAFENQEYQFEDLVRKVLKKRELSRNPLFDIMFQLQHGATRDATTSSGNSGAYGIEAVYDLALQGTEGEEDLLLSLTYRTCLFKEETVRRIIDNFKEIIDLVTRNKEIKLKDIKISHQLADCKLELIEEAGDFAF